MLRLTACVLLIAIASCKAPDLRAHDPAQVPQFALRVLEETYLDGGAAEAIEYSLHPAGERIAVDVYVTGAGGLKACYIELDYDAARWNPVSAQAGAMWGDTRELLELPVLHQRGTVSYGAVLAQYDDAAGIDGDGVLATVVFERGEFAATTRTSTSIDIEREFRTLRSPMTFDPETKTMRWFYAQPGDYDQNGEVNVSDLSRLALYFGQSYDISSFNTYETTIAVTDGDINGEISMADIGVIGGNFGVSIGSLDIFAVEATELFPHYPIFPSRESPDFVRIGSVAFDSALGDPAQERISFSVPLTTPHKMIWAQPVTSEGRGVPTRYGWGSARQPGIDIYDPVGYQLRYESGVLRWYWNLWWDFDQNGIANPSDMAPFGAMFGEASNGPHDYAWSLDRYHDGNVGFDDFLLGFLLLNNTTYGYYVYHTTASADVPADPYASEQLFPADQLYVDNGQRGFHQRTSFAWGGWGPGFYWVRPYTRINGIEQIGTRSGVAHVP